MLQLKRELTPLHHRQDNAGDLVSGTDVPVICDLAPVLVNHSHGHVGVFLPRVDPRPVRERVRPSTVGPCLVLVGGDAAQVAGCRLPCLEAVREPDRSCCAARRNAGPCPFLSSLAEIGCGEGLIRHLILPIVAGPQCLSRDEEAKIICREPAPATPEGGVDKEGSRPAPRTGAARVPAAYLPGVVVVLFKVLAGAGQLLDALEVPHFSLALVDAHLVGLCAHCFTPHKGG